MARRLVSQDIGTGRHALLPRHEEIETVETAPGPADMNEADSVRRLLLYPAGNRLVAVTGGDHEVRPWRLDRTGLLLVDAGERRPQHQVCYELMSSIDELLDLERPAEGFGERENQVVVLGIRQYPDPRRDSNISWLRKSVGHSAFLQQTGRSNENNTSVSMATSRTILKSIIVTVCYARSGRGREII